MADKLHEGSELTDEELKEVGLTSPDEVSDALEKSIKNVMSLFLNGIISISLRK